MISIRLWHLHRRLSYLMCAGRDLGSGMRGCTGIVRPLSHLSHSFGEQAIRTCPDLSLARDVLIKDLAGDAEFDAQLGDLGFRPAPRCLRDQQIGGCHLEGHPPWRPRPRGDETSTGVPDHQLAHQLGKACKDYEDRVALKVVI